MSSKGFALLWSKILDSSIWMESKETRLVWITMLAMKDVDGRVIASPKALAHRARVTEVEGMEAIGILMSPDEQSGSRVEEGRRIREIPGGWEIINHEQYRFSTAAKREFWRQQKREQRMKKTPRKKRSPPTGRETRFVEAVERGDEESADRIVGEGL